MGQDRKHKDPEWDRKTRFKFDGHHLSLPPNQVLTIELRKT
jgi:hypothetical protein